MGKVLEVILVSLLWYIGSILIVTAGTSSAALYYTVHKCIFNSEGYLFSTYKKSFTDNLKKATLLWLICLVLDAFLVFDLLLAKMAIDQNSLLGVLYYPVLVCMVLAFMWQLSVMAYQARFEDSIRAVLYKSALIAFRNMGWMIFLTLFLTGLIYLCRYLIVLVVILPGAYTCLMHHVFEHIYTKAGWISRDVTD